MMKIADLRVGQKLYAGEIVIRILGIADDLRSFVAFYAGHPPQMFREVTPDWTTEKEKEQC